MWLHVSFGAMLWCSCSCSGNSMWWVTGGMRGEWLAFISDYPFVAMIWRHKIDKTYVCSGAIISRHWMLTTGDCMTSENGGRISTHDLFVTAGHRQWAPGSENYVRSIVIHEDYSNRTGQDNIALVRVERNFHLATNCQPAFLPLPDETVDYQRCMLVRGHKLNKVNTYPIGLDECSDLHSNQDLELNDDENMCTYDPDRWNFACGKYAGGALLVCGLDNEWMVHGILHYSPGFYNDSWPSCQERDGNPEVYTKFSGYLDWIENMTN